MGGRRHRVLPIFTRNSNRRSQCTIQCCLQFIVDRRLELILLVRALLPRRRHDGDRRGISHTTPHTPGLLKDRGVHDRVPILPMPVGFPSLVLHIIGVDLLVVKYQIIYIKINVQFRGNTERAFDTFPDELGARQNTFSGLGNPQGVGDFRAGGAGKPHVEVYVTPLRRIAGKGSVDQGRYAGG